MKASIFQINCVHFKKITDMFGKHNISVGGQVCILKGTKIIKPVRVIFLRSCICTNSVVTATKISKPLQYEKHILFGSQSW